MRLADFIEEHADLLIDDWRVFARQLRPGEGKFSPQDLDDSARTLLENIVCDMRCEQSAEEQLDKSRGHRPANAPGVTHDARSHADKRLAQGFTLDDMVAEYRALRASVARHWINAESASGPPAMSELVRFDEALDQALTESIARFSARLTRYRDLFVGVLAHDFRTPLQAVSMFAETIRREPRAPARCAESAGRIQRSALQLQALVNSLLDFTRTRLGNLLPVVTAEVALDGICRQAADELRAISPQTEIAIQLDGELKGVWDASRLSQLISNLLGNAVLHGKSGGPVTLTADGTDAQCVHISVANEGAPIPPDLLPTLFDPFVTSSPQREGAGGAGLGLGLYIAKQIAIAHGGEIRVLSAAGNPVSGHIAS